MPRIKYDEGEKTLYIVKREGSLYRVLDSRGVIQFTSMARINCTDWVRSNSPLCNNSPKENHANP